MTIHRHDRPRRRGRNSLLAATVLAGSALALGASSSVSAAPVTVTFGLSGTLQIGDTELPLPDGATWTGKIDRDAETITEGESTIPDIIIPPTPPLNLEVTVRITDAAPSTGTVTPEGDVALNVQYSAELVGLGCEITPIDVDLSSANGVPLDAANTFAVLAADGFTVPAMEATGGCLEAVATGANDTLALPNSSTAIQLTLQKASTPSVPRSLAATPGDKKVDLTWSAPANDGNVAISSYKVQTSLDGTTWANAGSPTARSFSVTGLSNGKNYSIRVAAVNSIGTGPYTVVKAMPFGKPGAPKSVTAKAGKKSATVSWKPAPSNGSKVNSYTVTASPGGKTCTAKGTDKSCVVKKLSTGKKFSFTVKAKNKAGFGASSKATKAIKIK